MLFVPASSQFFSKRPVESLTKALWAVFLLLGEAGFDHRFHVLWVLRRANSSQLWRPLSLFHLRLTPEEEVLSCAKNLIFHLLTSAFSSVERRFVF